MDCSEKRVLQQKCEAAWNAYADYAGAIKELTTSGARPTVLTPPMAAFFGKSPDYIKARHEYHECVRVLEQHMVHHRC